MKIDIEKVKEYNLKICIGWSMLVASFVFVLGLTFQDTTQYIPWWASLTFGYSVLIIGFRLSKIIYKEE